MKKMNNILKMISQMDANANEIKLAKHEVELATIYDDIKGTLTEVNKDYVDALGYTGKAITLCKLSLVKNQNLLKELNKAESLIRQIGLDTELKKVLDVKNQVISSIKQIENTITNFQSI
jgi:hypothetical protein